MAIDGYEPDPSIKPEPIQKGPQRNNDRRGSGEKRSSRSNQEKGTGKPRRERANAAKGKPAAASPWKSAQKKVRQSHGEG